MSGSLGGLGASRIRTFLEHTTMTKNLILAAILATSAGLSFAQAPAKPATPAGATPTVAAPAAEAKPAAKKATKKKAPKKAAKGASAAK
jgi:hypothetical protein